MSVLQARSVWSSVDVLVEVTVGADASAVGPVQVQAKGVHSSEDEGGGAGQRGKGQLLQHVAVL